VELYERREGHRVTADELAVEVLRLETVELVMMRNRINREIHRRFTSAVIGEAHGYPGDDKAEPPTSARITR
jgi:hypothetical protein